MKRILMLIILIGSMFLIGCESEEPMHYEGILDAVVVDNETGEPVEGALVFLGRGSDWKCYTSNQGSCRIDNFAFGDYSLNVVKKNYVSHSFNPTITEDNNHFFIEIEQKPEPDTSFVIEGKVIEIVTAR